MDTSFVHSQPAVRTRGQTLRAYVVSLVGPTTAAAGLIWAILQPYRVTLLHPRVRAKSPCTQLPPRAQQQQLARIRSV